jgi:hypothetical protein
MLVTFLYKGGKTHILSMKDIQPLALVMPVSACLGKPLPPALGSKQWLYCITDGHICRLGGKKLLLEYQPPESLKILDVSKTLSTPQNRLV